MNNSENNLNEEKSELFITLLAEHERALTRYVLAIIPYSIDAEDILQESKLVMWRHFSKFEEGSNFKAWARQIIFNRIMAFRKKKGKETERYVFTDKFYETVNDDIIEHSDRRDKELKNLKTCIGKLQGIHQEMIGMRYNKSMSMESVAEKIGRTVGATYRSLSRVRANLRKCMQTGKPS